MRKDSSARWKQNRLQVFDNNPPERCNKAGLVREMETCLRHSTFDACEVAMREDSSARWKRRLVQLKVLYVALVAMREDSFARWKRISM